MTTEAPPLPRRHRGPSAPWIALIAFATILLTSPANAAPPVLQPLNWVTPSGTVPSQWSTSTYFTVKQGSRDVPVCKITGYGTSDADVSVVFEQPGQPIRCLGKTGSRVRLLRKTAKHSWQTWSGTTARAVAGLKLGRAHIGAFCVAKVQAMEFPGLILRGKNKCRVHMMGRWVELPPTKILKHNPFIPLGNGWFYPGKASFSTRLQLPYNTVEITQGRFYCRARTGTRATGVYFYQNVGGSWRWACRVNNHHNGTNRHAWLTEFEVMVQNRKTGPGALVWQQLWHTSPVPSNAVKMSPYHTPCLSKYTPSSGIHWPGELVGRGCCTRHDETNCEGGTNWVLVPRPATVGNRHMELLPPGNGAPQP